MRPSVLLPAILALGLVSFSAQAPPVLAAPALVEDGPYVIWDGPKARVLRVRAGKAEAKPLGADHQLQIDGLPALTLDPLPPVSEPCVFPQPSRIAAVSDIHGNFSGLATLLEHQNIMDGARRWTFGQGHLVVVGDVFDRGGGVTECIWLLRSLQAQAAKAGGHVHVLLGNHEAMTLAGDLRYLNPKYAAAAALLGLGMPALNGPDSEQGRWLRNRNAMLRLGDILFVHGGPSPALASAPGELPALNAQIRLALGQRGASPLLGNTGPLWYRGLIPGASQSGDATEAQVTEILQAFHAKVLVVGHSTQEQVTAFHQGRVFGIDANLQSPPKGELWLWEQGKTFRGLRDGRRVPLI